MSSVLKQSRLSHEEYFALEQKEDQRYEYIAGDIFAMVGGSESHALITMNIGAACQCSAQQTLPSLWRRYEGVCPCI
jgi:Uma2 family endonuclease